MPLIVIAGLLLVISLVAVVTIGYSKLHPDPKRWESDIVAIEQRTNPDADYQTSALFVGSSSIRFWDSLQEDMQPIPTVNHGFGGAQTSDILFYADRLITRFNPKVIVLYTGENDLGSRWSWSGLAVERVKNLIQYIHKSLPDTEIILLSIKPSPYFNHRRQIQEQANLELRSYAEATEKVTFIDVTAPLLDSEGKLRPEFYSDGLHLNSDGYAVWKRIIRSKLLEYFPNNQ